MSCTFILQNFVQPPTRADVVLSQRLVNEGPAQWDANNDLRAERQCKAEKLDQKTHTYLQYFLLLNDCI